MKAGSGLWRAWNFVAAEGIGRASALGSGLAYAFLLSPEEFGILAVMLAAIGVAQAVLPLGSHLWLMRTCAHDAGSASQAMRVAARIVAFSTFSAAVPLVFSVWFFGVQAISVEIAVLFALLSWASARWVSVGGHFAKGLGEAQRLRTASIVRGVGRLGGVVLVVVFGASVTRVLAIELISTVLFGLPLIRLATTRERHFSDACTTVAALRYGLPLLPHTASHWVLHLADRWIVAALAGPAAAGAYALAYQFAQLVYMLSSAGYDAAVPVLVGGDAAKIERAFRLLWRSALVAAIGLGIIGPLVILLLFEPSYHAGIVVPGVAGLGLVATVWYYQSAGAATLLAHKSEVLWPATVSAAIINIVANFALVPLLGLAGAALATFVAYWALAFMTRRRVLRAGLHAGVPPIIYLRRALFAASAGCVLFIMFFLVMLGERFSA